MGFKTKCGSCGTWYPSNCSCQVCINRAAAAASRAAQSAAEKNANAKIKELEAQVKIMRNEHELMLTELQAAQRRQLETLKKNEKVLEERLGLQQGTIVELTNQNESLKDAKEHLVENQKMMMAAFMQAMMSYKKMTEHLATKLDDKELIKYIKEGTPELLPLLMES